MRPLFVTLILSSLVSVAGAGPKMSSETHSLVIEKLEKALKAVKEDETVTLKPIRARLADLYADRARLRAIEEVEQNCKDCTGSKEDRKKALQMYEVVVREADKESQGNLLLQMSHLHQLQGEPAKAEAIYERVIREGTRQHDRLVVAQAYAGRAERRFTRSHYAQAQGDFEASYKMGPPHRRGPMLHRIAWCHLNQGRQSKAVDTILKVLRSPDLLTREATGGATLDVSFQEDLSNDLASFLARGHVGPSEIRLVESLAPDKNKREALKHLASECERLGNKKAALSSWDAVLSLETGDEDRLETTVRVAQIRFDLGQKPAALRDLQSAVAIWKKRGCKDEALCSILKLRLRNLVADWNRGEKKKPTDELLAAYRSYISLFSDDMQMTHWAAIVARGLKKYSEGAVLYHKASLLAVSSKEKDAKEILDSSLVGEIEMAELSKDFKARQAAYDHYLALAPNGAISHKVRYQRAYLAYEMKNMREAASRLGEFANSKACMAAKAGAQTLCIQAADLDLDARVALKDDVSVEESGLRYAKIYPSRKLEYLKIARTAALKQAEKYAESGDPEKGVKKLEAVDMTGADKDERLKVLKIRMALAERAEDIRGAKSAANEILATKGISDEDRELALGRIVWAHEMLLDFGPAYRITQKLKLPKMSAADRELRLALLAELAGLNARKHEEAYLKMARNPQQHAIIRAKMVRSSRNPVREFRTFERDIARIPTVYANLALEVFARTNDFKFAEQALRSPAVRQDPAGRVLMRQLFLKEFMQLERKLGSHRIRTESDYLVQKTLSDRLALVAQAEAATNQAISLGDWTAQLVTLAVVSRENKRLNSDIMNLPVPAKLKAKERTAYAQAVAAKAKTFSDKHIAIEEKLKGFWKNSAAFQDLSTQYARATRPEIRALLGREMKWIATVAPDNRKYDIEDDLKNRSLVPSMEKVASAMRDIRESPFNERYIRRLRDLESDRGNDTMVTYLDARLEKMKSIKVAKGDN